MPIGLGPLAMELRDEDREWLRDQCRRAGLPTTAWHRPQLHSYKEPTSLPWWPDRILLLGLGLGTLAAVGDYLI